jgi:hypothetical protein
VVTGGSDGIGAAASRTIEAKDDSLGDHHTSGGLSRRKAASDLLSMEPNGLRNLSFAAPVVRSPGDAAIPRRIGSADQAMLSPDNRCSRLGQREETNESLHRLSLTLDPHLPRAQSLLQGAPLIDHLSKRGCIRLYDRIRPLLYTPALHLKASIPNLSAKALLPKPKLIDRLKPLCSARVEHRPKREDEGVNTQSLIAGPSRGARTPPPKPYDHRLEFLTPLCELVDPRCRRRSKLAPPYYPSPLELSQALGEDVGARGGQACSQVGEAFGSEQKLAHDQKCPPLAYEVEGVSRGASVAVCAHGSDAQESTTSSPELRFLECFTEFSGSFLGLLPYAPSRRLRHNARGDPERPTVRVAGHQSVSYRAIFEKGVDSK